ncbi:DNA adenine methylase [Pasteurella canis]|uniref:DNA adenine methylase n=1 Tax=Pasteurella canis TaxID=753 RepID=UPI001CBD096F|nr:DNA adenine methylase [Pasteurella canis]UAX41399.1 DNA adenine methylase [Pasteurella canis]
MSKFLSPLRYPGGKTAIYPFISKLLDENNLLGGAYAEPYAGGAGLALKLLKNNLVKEIYLNDFDKAIYALWYSILHYPDNLIEWISNVNISVEIWEQYKDIYKNEKDDLFKLGKATLFLNRTNISGVIKGGVIGGKNQQGKYKIDARFNKNDLIKKIEGISSLKDKIHLFNMDGIDFVKKLNKDIFIYFDPPYYKKGSELYLNFFRDEDHKALSYFIKTLGNKWMVSYDNEDFIKNLYMDYDQIIYGLYQSTSNKKGKEIIIFSKELSFIDSISFLDIKTNN